ncbi:maltokinase [Microlunatus elymi]|uniref:Maltokinase n=1 Tax=Microlunatus elymi TaxID=2596828 RepID=A0A516Q1C3_9ACTN|nr:maltokinase [Microlunatus elymi]QDP97011.1 maltokinase [Microlunatus elymi]
MINGRLIDHLTSARWFGGNRRTARVSGTFPLPWLREPGNWPAVRLEIARIVYQDSDLTDLYQLLISYHPDHDPGDALLIIDDPDHGRLAGVDATEDPAAHQALLDVIIGAVRGSSPGPSTSSAPSGGSPASAGADLVPRLLDGSGLQPSLPSQVFGGEQSNTSIEYAHKVILKLFRHLHPGRNRDIETLAALTRADCPDVPALRGWLEGRWVTEAGDEPVTADLAMLTTYIPRSRDGWEFALAEYRLDHDFTGPAHDLGHSLARVHAELRRQFPANELGGDQVATTMRQRLTAALAEVPQLVGDQPRLTTIFESLLGRRVAVQRVHADFHLGQALHTPDGWKIIDFEGEPATSDADRSRPDSVWRDVAGALRSFDYVAAHDHVLHSRAIASSWVTACQQAFLDGYGKGASRTVDRDLLRAYLADKAIYETVYEARHRPDWLPIPLAAVAGLSP